MPKNTLPARTLHGIDMGAPDAIEQLLAYHRTTFGDAVMMADSDADDDTDEDAEDTDDQGDDAEDDGDADDQDGKEDLGDKGKRALDAMKAKLKAAKKQAREAAAERDQLKSDKDNAGKTPDEKAIEDARAEARAEAAAAANKRILRSEVKAAAAGKLSNPALAVKLIDLDEFEVDDDGNVDEDEIAEAITNLLKENPFLAAQRGSGGFDTARGKPKPKSKQMSLENAVANHYGDSK